MQNLRDPIQEAQPEFLKPSDTRHWFTLLEIAEDIYGPLTTQQLHHLEQVVRTALPENVPRPRSTTPSASWFSTGPYFRALWRLEARVISLHAGHYTLELEDGYRIGANFLPRKSLKDSTKPLFEYRGRIRLGGPLRTRPDGTLFYRLDATAYHGEVAEDEPWQAGVFAFTGKVVRLDRAVKRAVVRVFPMAWKSGEPFVVGANAALEQLSLVEDANYVHVEGRINGSGVLIAEHMEQVKLRVPDRWREWKPPHKRQEIREPTVESDAKTSHASDSRIE
jgi:hypothetical protein